MSIQHIIATKHFPALAYRQYGSGPAIMLIHGFPASGNLWAGVVTYLAESLTVLVPDVPGTGDSKMDGEAVTMEELATIVPAIFDDAGITQGVVAGHSMGGYIALAAAELFGKRLSGLALVHSTAIADDEEKKEKRRKSIEIIRKGGKEQFVRGMIPGLFSKAFKDGHPEIIQERIEEGIKLPSEALIAFYNAMIDRPERLEVLRSAHFPVQWISGREDTTIPWQASLQQSSLPVVSFVKLYDECGHMSMLEQKELLQKDLLMFVEYCLQRVAEVR
jgi:pimeloyl-ACP methyl ester carboxylesterase